MNIIVCVKQVPDTEKIQIDTKKHVLIREGVARIMNPYDGYALEAAARVKDLNPETGITVVSMGPPQAEKILRECLAIAADRAYLITDPAFSGSDTYATSLILSQAIKYIEESEKTKFQAIFCGKQAIDGETAQVGPEMAEQMGYPQITSCLSVKEGQEELVVLQESELEKRVLGISCPCVLTFTKADQDPRFPSIKRKMEAKKAVIPQIGLKDLKRINKKEVGLQGSPTKVKTTYVQMTKREGTILDLEQAGVEKCLQMAFDAITRGRKE